MGDQCLGVKPVIENLPSDSQEICHLIFRHPTFKGLKRIPHMSQVNRIYKPAFQYVTFEKQNF